MSEIPKDIIEDVEKIAEELVAYKNVKNLDWARTYDEVLEKLDLEDKKKDMRLLKYVVTQITKLGYDINDTPFNLTRYK